MPIRFIGLNNRTAPVETRELFSFDAHGVQDALQKWLAQEHGVEATLVSTCNRTELYFATESGEIPDFKSAFPYLAAPNFRAQISDDSFEQFRKYFLCLEDGDAVEHLFSVASSLDSMILGEPQILMQMKRAYELAVQAKTTGPILNEAFQSAFKTAKRVSVETEIFRRRVSVPSVAVVDFILNIFERLNDKKTLVLGAGEMAEETLKFLVDYGAEKILVTNRSRDKAEVLAQQWNGTVVDWSKRIDALADVDLAICATGATEPIVTLEHYLEIEKIRNNGSPLTILDLAVPRNVDPQIGERSNVYLYSIDDLEAACARNRELRDKEIPKALKIAREEAEKFIKNINARKSIGVILKLRNGWNEIKDAEVERLLRKIDCDAHTEEEIRYAFDRLVNKLLHSPTTSLRDASQSEYGMKLTDAIKRLFRL